MQHPSQSNLTLLSEDERDREELPATVVLDLQLFLAETVLIIVVLLVVIVKRTCFDGCRSSSNSSSSSSGSDSSEDCCNVPTTDDTTRTTSVYNHVKSPETQSSIAQIFEHTTRTAEEEVR